MLNHRLSNRLVCVKCALPSTYISYIGIYWRSLCRPCPLCRCTAFGFLNALCKLAAVLGISIFQSFVGITKAVPILFAAGALAAGSFLATKLPETRGQVLQ